MLDLKKMMTTSISEVLETMFFMALEFEEHIDLEGCGILSEDNVRVCQLAFNGSFSGHFTIFVPENILTTMAEDFMGESRENITREHSDGIIMEVINMVAGNMFAALDNQVEFKLGIPEMVEAKTTLPEIANTPPEKLVLAESIEGYLGFTIKTD